MYQLIDALSSAYILAFLQSILIGGTYRFLVNKYDPKKQLQNPPRSLSFLTNVFKEEKEGSIESKVLYRLGNLSNAKVINKRNDNNNKDGHYHFDIQLWVTFKSDYYYLGTVTRNSKQLSKIALSYQLPKDINGGNVLEFSKHDIECIIKYLASENSFRSEGDISDFIGLNLISSRSDINDNKYSLLKIFDLLDPNILAFTFMIIITIYPVYYLTNKAAIDLNLSSSIPLILCIELDAMCVIYGRTHRHEIDKNVESVRRWLYAIPTCSIFLFISSGLHAFYFYFLVLMLKFIMDTCRTMIRILRTDASVKHDGGSAIKTAFQFIGGLYVTCFILVLSVIVSHASETKMTNVTLTSTVLILVVGYLYYSISVI